VPEGAHSIDPFRLIPSKCVLDKPFRSNNKFKIISGDKTCFQGGKLEFARGDEKPDGCYKTFVTPCYHSSGLIWQNLDEELEIAFNYRLGCVREPLRVGFHEQLMSNQNMFFKNNTVLSNFADDFSRYLDVVFENIGDMDVELCKYSHMPHPKKKLRIRAMKNILDSGDFYHRTFNKSVTGKVKRAEIAKANKATRLINDLTCEGSLLAGFVADKIKSAMASYTKEHFFQFVKSPDLGVLSTVFSKLISPEGGFYFPFFSDDSCVAIRCVDGVFMANVDISSCDGSHGKVVFDFLRRVTRGDSRLFRYVDGAIKQCEMGLTLVSSATRQKVVLKPSTPTLYSGSTLTTLINNFANIAIACAVKSALRSDLRKSDCEGLVRSAAESAGYIVTVQVCETYHGLQFLKHSPCETATLEIVPVLNLGVVLRSLGCCWGDLPSYSDILGRKASFEQRAYLYNTSQVQCYKNGPTHSLVRKLRSMYKCHVDIPYDPRSWLLNNITGDYSMYSIPDHEIATRYGVSAEDIQELCSLTQEGVMINCTASRAILSLDYGL